MSFQSRNDVVGLDTFSRRFVLRVAFLLFSNHLQMIFMLTESQHGCPPGYSKDEFIFSGNGYVVLSRNESIPKISSVIKFDFKTTKSEGLLFFSGSQRKKSFLSLELRNGKILFQFDLGSGRATVVSNQRYDDGKWHVLEARLMNRNGSLLVDGVTVSSATCPGSYQRFSPTDRVHLGGFNGHHNVQGVSVEGFEGSIKDVRFENADQSITTYVEKKNVIFGCPKRRKRSNDNEDIRSLGVDGFYASYIGATNIEIKLEATSAASCTELHVHYRKEEEFYDHYSTRKARKVTDYLVEISELEKNTTYEFWISSSSSDYGYPNRRSHSMRNTTGTGLSMVVDSVTETSISVSWPDFVQGELYYALSGNDSWQSQSSVSGTGYNLTELTPGTAYSVRFINATGEVVEREISTRPSPPTVRYNALLDSISLSWKNSEKVEVNYTKVTHGECRRIMFSGTDGRIPDLGPGCTYHLEMVALSNDRKSEKTTQDVTMKEYDPQNLTCRPGNNQGQIRCEWGPKQNMSCQQFLLKFTSSRDSDSYNVEARRGAHNTERRLTGGLNYSISIQKADIPENSTIGVVTTEAIAQLEVYKESLETVRPWQNDRIVIKYHHDNSQEIEYYNVSLGNQSYKLQGPNYKASFDHLDAGTCYSLSASAVSLGLTSKWIVKEVCTVPNPPSSVNCNGSTNSSLTLRIVKPSEGKFDYYMYKNNRLNHHTSSGFDFVTIDGFKPFKTYDVDVRTALNTTEQSDAETVTCETAQGRPREVKNFHNTSFDTHSLSLQWDEPEVKNGIITGYVIRYRAHGRQRDHHWMKHEINENKRRCHLDDLQPGTTYSVKIVAKTDAGEGDPAEDRFTLKAYDPLQGMLIASVVLLPILLIVLVALLVCYFVRNSPSRLESVRRISSRIMNRNMEMRVFKQPSVISKPVKVSEFLEYVKVLEKDSGLKFTEEYEDLKYIGRNQNKDEAELQCNRVKNRFTNILPYDISRVKLLPVEDEEGSDYINASWIPGFHSKREFIASQGPLPSTITDFWRMIWENNCQAIVMLTLCVEKGHIKCEQYWPMDNEPVFYGDVKVEIQNEDKAEEWHVREFKLSLGAQSRKLWHLHYISWPDMYVPEKLSLIAFIRIVRETFNKNLGKGPIVVHCSAGVGRTGTFVALDTLLHQLQEDHDLDIYGVVFQMRMCRVLMVQTEVQYIFIYECLKQVLEERNGLGGTKSDEALMDGNETKRYIIDSNSEEQIKDEKQPLVKSPKEEDSGKVSDKENEKQPISDSVKTEETKVESNKEEKEVNKEPVNKEPVSKDTETSKEPVKKDTESSKEPVKTDTESNKEPVKKDTESSKEPVSKDTESSKEPVSKDTESSKEPEKKDTESKPNVELQKETTGKE